MCLYVSIFAPIYAPLWWASKLGPWRYKPRRWDSVNCLLFGIPKSCATPPKVTKPKKKKKKKK